MDKIQRIEELLSQKKEKLIEQKQKKQQVMAKYADKGKSKPLSTTDRIARIEEILGIE